MFILAGTVLQLFFNHQGKNKHMYCHSKIYCTNDYSAYVQVRLRIMICNKTEAQFQNFIIVNIWDVN